MTFDKEEIKFLCNSVEEAFTKKVITPADFEELANFIYERTNQRLSVSTLKRIWGYVDGYKTIRNSTLNILTLSIGFKDWDEFKKYYNKTSTSSNFIFSKSIKAEEIAEGKTIRLTWAPNRLCVLKHLGDSIFEVIAVENSKLQVGDTFHCSCFIFGKPLYVDQLQRGDKPPKLFVLGNKGGLTSIEILD